MLPNKRGTFIAFEGEDKVGKTTQANRLIQRLTLENKRTILINFPDRSTDIGKIINLYLTRRNEYNDQAIHLLFSANRWELKSKIISALESGINVCVDRYAFSGVAYSASKPGLNIDWCKQSDRGLPRPDIVCFLETQNRVPALQAQYGEERYENPEFQQQVRNKFNLLRDNTWVEILGDKSRDEVHEEIYNVVITKMDEDKGPLCQLWMNN